MNAVLNAAQTSRYRPARVLIASTGLRKGEALELSWDHVDLDTGSLRVAATISRIGGRLIVTDPKTVPVITVASRAAKVDDVGVHTLRHSAAVAWLESGVHIKAVADVLGHSSIAITGDVDGHTSDDTARAAFDGLAERLGLADVGGHP